MADEFPSSFKADLAETTSRRSALSSLWWVKILLTRRQSVLFAKHLLCRHTPFKNSKPFPLSPSYFFSYLSHQSLCLPCRDPARISPSHLRLGPQGFPFCEPCVPCLLVASRINYWLVQAILAADVGNSVVRAHDMRKFAFSVNWARRADMSHIIKHGFWSSVHPFLNNYLTPLEGPFPDCIAAGSRVWIGPSQFFFFVMGCNRGEGEGNLLCSIPYFCVHTFSFMFWLTPCIYVYPSVPCYGSSTAFFGGYPQLACI